jgi:hypothetical protein
VVNDCLFSFDVDLHTIVFLGSTFYAIGVSIHCTIIIVERFSEQAFAPVLMMEREPYLIIADEPANHLDLPSIICLEDALEETDCGLLLVSHDRRFLDKLSDQCWNIKPNEGGGAVEVTY